MPESKWGGKRPGAGRPKGSGDFPRQLAVRVTEEQYEFAMSQDVDAAEYIRTLIERDMHAPIRPPTRPE